jgi:putative flippase GtrA
LEQLLRFVLVGGLNTVLTTGLYLLLVYLGVYYHIALACDYATGILIGFLLNRKWTFSATQGKSGSFLRYLSTYLAVYAGNAALLTFIVEAGWLGPKIGQIVALAIVSGARFVLQKYWVFRHRNAGR